MAIVGDLADLGVPDLLYMFKMRGITGRLVLQRSDVDAILQFQQGRLVSVTSGQVWHRLGDLLVRAHKLSQEEIERALVLQAVSEEAVPLGTWLVRNQFVSEEDLHDVLGYQAEEILLRVMTWTDGTFAFNQETPASPAVPLPEINIEQIILEAVRQADELAELKAQALNHNYAFVLNDPGSVRLDGPLSLKESIIVSSIAGGANRLNQVAQMTQLAELDVLRLIDGLARRGLLSIRGPDGAIVQLLEGRVEEPAPSELGDLSELDAVR